MPDGSALKETGRIEAFSDAVFAIAITILVLAIKVPTVSNLKGGGLLPALLALWPHYLAFVTGFATILAIWVNHHRIFTFVQKSDHFLLYWNGLLLLLITFLSFPTALLAEHLLQPEGRVAGVVFVGTLLAIALIFNGMWRYASKNSRFLVNNIDPADIEQITKQHRHGPLLYAVAFVIAFWSAEISAGICLCLAVFFGFKGWPTKR